MSKVLILTTVDSTVWAFLRHHVGLLRSLGAEVDVACAEGPYTPVLTGEGISTVSIPFSRRPYSPLNLRALVLVRRLISRGGYRIVYCHTPVASMLGTLAARLCGVPVTVYMAHGLLFQPGAGPVAGALLYPLERSICALADYLVVVNQGDYDLALSRGMMVRERVLLLRGVGVDTERFKPRADVAPDFGLTPENQVVAIVGEMIPRKRHTDFLQAARLILEAHPATRFLLIGDGPLMAQLRGEAGSLGVASACIFAGWRLDVERVLQHVHILVHPAVREGLPFAVMEAMSTERPVIAAENHGTRDLVLPGVTGYLVSPRSPAAIADRVVELLSSPEQAAAMGKAARRHVVEHFSLQAVMPLYADFYARLLRQCR